MTRGGRSLPTVEAVQTLTPEEVAILCRAAEGLDVYVVGGQATNFWATMYSDKEPALEAFAPFTSKDIDFYGKQDAAEEIARRIEGTLQIPPLDDAGPNSAVVLATLHDRKIVIDFLMAVLGVEDASIKAEAQVTSVPIEGAESVELLVLHPLHCLQSRIANLRKLGRDDAIALRQLNAAPYVLQAFIEEMVESNPEEMNRSLKGLFKYLRSDIYGRRAHLIPQLAYDPLNIIRKFKDDLRLDSRYRSKTLAGMIRQIEIRRKGML